jgi:hypothetical protein
MSRINIIIEVTELARTDRLRVAHSLNGGRIPIFVVSAPLKQIGGSSSRSTLGGYTLSCAARRTPYSVRTVNIALGQAGRLAGGCYPPPYRLHQHLHLRHQQTMMVQNFMQWLLLACRRNDRTDTNALQAL